MRFIRDYLTIDIVITFTLYLFLFYNVFDLNKRVCKINNKIDLINMELTYIFQDFQDDNEDEDNYKSK